MQFTVTRHDYTVHIEHEYLEKPKLTRQTGFAKHNYKSTIPKWAIQEFLHKTDHKVEPTIKATVPPWAVDELCEASPFCDVVARTQ
jgi:hypothetical protein